MINNFINKKKYRHKKSGGIYVLIYDNVKDKINDSLYDCCVYQAIDGTLYVRSKFDFDLKFEEVKDETSMQS